MQRTAEEQEEGTVKRLKSAAGTEDDAAAGGVGHEDGSTPPSDSEADEAESSDDGGFAVSEKGGNEVLFEACHEALKLDLLQVVMEPVGEGHFLFLADTSKEWRARYTHLYPALKTNISSVVSCAEHVRWAIKQGLELTVKVFKVAARYGDVGVCKALHGANCPWNQEVCRETVYNDNEQHGLSILQWLRSEDLPEKERCPWSDYICGDAGAKGRLAMLEWSLSKEANAPFSCFDWIITCRGGSIPAVEYLLNHPRTRSLLDEENGDAYWPLGATVAASQGCLGVLQLLHAKARHLCRWDAAVCQAAVMNAKSLATLKWLRSEAVQCPWDERSCPQLIRERGLREAGYGREWDIDTDTFEEMKQWVHANGHPCHCQE